MKRSTAFFFAAAVVVTFAASEARAHIQMNFPTPRTAMQKEPVCGQAGSKRGTKINLFRPGQVITVRWQETVGHPGHFRVAFDDDGQDFPSPVTAKDTVVMPVFIDGIADQTGTMNYQQAITLPNIECANCTLQIIQVMKEQPPYDPTAGTDVYYQCADVTLSKTAPPGGGPTDVGPDVVRADAAPRDAGAGGAGGSPGAGGSQGAGGSGTPVGGTNGGSGGATGATAAGGSGGGAPGSSPSPGASGSAGGGPTSAPEARKADSGCLQVATGEPSVLSLAAAAALALLAARRRRRR